MYQDPFVQTISEQDKLEMLSFFFQSLVMQKWLSKAIRSPAYWPDILF